MPPCVAVGGAECRPFGMALPSLLVQPGMRWEVDVVSADAACMLALLSDAAHEGGGSGAVGVSGQHGPPPCSTKW